MPILYAHQPDDVFGSATAPIQDEDFWQNEVAPAPTPLYANTMQWSFDQNEIVPFVAPPSLGGDEDYNPLDIWKTQQNVTPRIWFLDWQYDHDFAFNGPFDWHEYLVPVVQKNDWAVVFSNEWFEQHEAPIGISGGGGTLYAGLGEKSDPEIRYQKQGDDPAGSLYQPDEDFWVNPVYPVTYPNLAPQQWVFEQHDPAGSLHGEPDEDFWINPVYPVIYPNLAPQQWIFEQHDPAGKLFGQPDEDFWINPVYPVTYPNLAPPQFLFEQYDFTIVIVTPVQDEDFWQNPVAPVTYPNLAPQQSAFEQHEIEVLLFDEDFWQNPTAPVTYPNLAPTQFGFEQHEPTWIYTDEDFWQNPTAPVTIPNAVPWQWLFEQFPYAYQPIGEPDEDFWVNQVAPVTILDQFPQQYSFYQDQPEPAGSLYGQDDEDFWANPTAPVTIPNLAPQQFIFEQDDPGGLFANVDEDLWINPVASVTYPNLAPKQWTFEQDDPGGLYAHVDEDFWQNPTVPVTYPNALLFQWTFEQGEEATQLHGQYEDDSWIYAAQPQPQQAILIWPQPFLGDEQTPTVFQAHEDYFQQPTAPQVAFEYQPLPYWFEAVETVVQPVYGGTEDYWITLPQSLSVTPVIPFWPWSFDATSDFIFIKVSGRTYIYFIG